MFAQRKARKLDQTLGTPLDLRSAEGTLLASFPHELVYSYRRMITGLMYRDALPKRLGLVAALREEGTTYTSLALGNTLANDLDLSVCVVELNWWNPGLSDQLAGKKLRKGKKPAATPALPDYHPILKSEGVAGVLMETSTLDDALIPVEQPNLFLLPAGALRPERRAVVARSQMLSDLIATLAQRFSHLVVDIPAILSTSDAVALASQVDACCLVVRQGVTPVKMVRHALDEIRHIHVAGTVLNQTKVSTPRWIFNLIPQE